MKVKCFGVSLMYVEVSCRVGVRSSGDIELQANCN